MQMNKHDSLSSLFTQNNYNDILSRVTILLLYLPRKTLRHGCIFNGTFPSCVMYFFGKIVNSNPNDFENPPK